MKGPRRLLLARRCAVCYKPLAAVRSSRRFCSAGCRKRASRKAQRQRRLEAQRVLTADVQRYLRQQSTVASEVILRGLDSIDPRIRRYAEHLAKKHALQESVSRAPAGIGSEPNQR